MTRRNRAPFAWLLLAGGCFTTASLRPGVQAGPGPLPQQTTQKKDTGGIRGCVVAADTGGPLRGAGVQAISTAIGVVRSTVTDSTGCYAFANLPDAGYAVQVSKVAYATVAFGEDPLSGREGQAIAVSDGELVRNVDFRILRAGVITGRVVDDAGEAVPNVLVQAVAVVRVSGDEQPALFPHAPSARRTDDLGRYRLFGLPPGDYCVLASPGSPGARPSPELAGFMATYFAGSPPLPETTVLAVKPGQEFQNIDIVLSARDPVRK